MTLTTLEIILIIIAVALAAATAYFALSRRKFALKTARHYEEHYTGLLRENESEIRRQIGRAHV